ncbi:MAG: hypothetical protein AB7O62_20530 [Pirellulales bacterium]
MSVMEQPATTPADSPLDQQRPSATLDVLVLVCGGLAAAGGIALLVLATLRTLDAANSVTVHWAGRAGRNGATTVAPSDSRQLAAIAPVPDPTLAALAAAAQRRAGQWDRPEWDALVAGQTAKAETDASGEIPRARRWQIYFPEGLTLTDYAAQLDTFGIELGMLAGGGQIEYATALSIAMPTRRQGPVEAEKRLYLSWTRGDLVAADRALLAKAGLDATDKIVVQFYPDTTEQELATLEQSYKGRPATGIYRTVFGIRPKLSTYEFYVREQVARE